MKISNSKKDLARIISENGGWRDESEFAAQDGDGTGSIDFFKSPPRYDKDDKYWKGEYDFCDRISQSGFTIKNFHQTILSRAEYFHLYPAPGADGWIEWNGGKCPVDKDARIDIRMTGGTTHYDTDTDWGWNADSFKITHYRLHKHEKSPGGLCGEAKLAELVAACEALGAVLIAAGVEPESDVAKADAEAKPTIEQLAADYSNAKDYAERKQQEADDAKADAEAKLVELVGAGRAIGLVLSVAVVEPELVITDWQDLQVGDVVWYGGDDGLSLGEYHVMEIETADYEGFRPVRVNDGDDGHWIDTRAGWRFIRRQ